jgi:hypothetical protein
MMLTGTWQPLPRAPHVAGLRAGSAVVLPDGRIVVTSWRQFERNGDCFAVYDPATVSWSVPVLAGPEGWDGCGGSDEFAWLPDGRLYGLSYVVDPNVDPWRIDYAGWRGDEHLPNSIGTTTAGRLYGPLNGCMRAGPCRGRLYEFDPQAGVIDIVSEYTEHHLDFVISGRASRLWVGEFGGDSVVPSHLASYDPETDEWIWEPDVPFPAHWPGAAIGPGGWLYVWTSFDTGGGEDLWAREPKTGEWYGVVLPEELRHGWDPSFVDGGDGRLYAFDPQHPYVFSPAGLERVRID